MGRPDVADVQRRPARPWEALPRDLAELLRPELPDLADEVIEAIRGEVPEYSRPLEGAFGDGLRRGVADSLGRFVGMIASGDASPDLTESVRLGRSEMRAGRALETLQSANRVGLRVAWRRFAGVATRHGFAAETVTLLGEAVIAYLDELAAASVEGYTQAHAQTALKVEQRRRRLVALIVREQRPDPERVHELATAVGWPLPDAVAVLVFGDEEPERVAARLGAYVLAGEVEGCACALVSDPDAPGRVREIGDAVAGTDAVIGPTTPWTEASNSFTRARLARELQSRNALPRGLVRADDHLLTLLLHQDEDLLDAVRLTHLAPLLELPTGTRARLEATLAAWMASGGSVAPAAAMLHVHPQTIRYRLAQLRELLDLEDDDVRLAAAISWRERVRPSR
jgi:PucR-like helix-turn-helix protein